MHPILSTSIEIVARVIPLIRSKFYNRLAWGVVGAGILLTTAPWWHDLVNAVAQKYLAVTLPSTAGNVGWGITLIVIGLAYHIVAYSIDELVIAQRQGKQQIVNLEHDKKIFENYRSVLSEEELLNVLEQIGNLHMYWSSCGTKFSNATTYLLAPSTQFATAVIKSSAHEFATKLNQLHHFLGHHFSEHNSPQTGDLCFRLYPDLNMDTATLPPTAEQSQKYDDYADQLIQLIDEVENSYKKFRSVVKQSLAV